MLFSLGGVEDAAVLDLFAGSGALGIEALSRGAARATFVDDDANAVATIRANLTATGFAGPTAQVVRSDAARFLATAPPFDLVLCDPPYGFEGWPTVLSGLVPVAGLTVIETGAPFALPDEWTSIKIKRYGGTVVTVARPAKQPGPGSDSERSRGDA